MTFTPLKKEREIAAAIFYVKGFSGSRQVFSGGSLGA
jgi:hypothetical protein